MAQTKKVSENFDKGKATWEETNGKKSSLPNGKSSSPSNDKMTTVLPPPTVSGKADAGIVQLVIAVAGIYASFLTWAYLQEKLTTTRHGPGQEVWHFPVFLNTIQSVLAALVGLVYLRLSTPAGAAPAAVIPSRRILAPLALVAVTSSLASPFGYASLAHIDYITFLLAKSCKLLPVMALHVAVFRRRYPLHKYAVVAAVTAGVAVFTLHSTKTRAKTTNGSGSGSTAWWGMLLLAVNLLFDGLTNSTQDHVFARFRPYSGPQMMCANNLMSSLVTGAYLVLGPAVLAATGPADWLGHGPGELRDALAFMARHPAVWKDVLGFAACGAIGQVFIFYTLATFSSVLLVTVTVTRKMVTMMLSVVAFGHRLSPAQWLGVGLVFGGIAVEALVARREKLAKEAAAAAAAKTKKM